MERITLCGMATGWRTHAACKGRGDVMFYEAHDSGAANIATAKAKAICDTCPVIDDCRDWIALDPKGPVDQSIVAGLTFNEQVVLRRQRRAERDAAKAAVTPPCGTRRGWERHQERGESCQYCDHWAYTRRLRTERARA